MHAAETLLPDPKSLSTRGPFARDAPLTSLTAFAAQGLTPETMAGVAGARVILANYDLLLHDFAAPLAALLGRHVPHACDLRAAEAQAIDAWLVAHTAFVSAPQAAQAYANTPIPLTGDTRTAWRPPRYGRAAVMDAPGGVLFDVKGCGVPPDEVPELPNSNGLLTLSEALYEFALERLVYAALVHGGSAVRPVPAYAIVDLGFDALALADHPDGRARATLLLRRAQTRPRCQWGKEDPGPRMAGLLLEIELSLRRYGISASNCGAVRFDIVPAHNGIAVSRDEKVLPFDSERLAQIARATGYAGRPLAVDGVNVQIADSEPPCTRVLDFGRYRLRPAFDAVLYTWWRRDYESLEGEFLRPDAPRYVQPEPALSMAALEAQPSWQALWEAAGNYGKGRLGRHALAKAFDGAVADATAHLACD